MGKNTFFYIGIVILAFFGIYEYFKTKREKRLSEAKKNIDEYMDNPFIGFSKLEEDFKFVGQKLEESIDKYEKENYTERK